MATDVCCNFELPAREIPIACDLDAISASDRPRYNELRAMLASAAIGRRALPDGFAIKIATGRMTLMHLAEWISFERKCCPFLEFRIELASDSGPVWLSLIGRPGVKEFLADVLAR
jgi:hypothetical protein